MREAVCFGVSFRRGLLLSLPPRTPVVRDKGLPPTRGSRPLGSLVRVFGLKVPCVGRLKSSIP